MTREDRGEGSCAGFTVVELLIVVAIIAIIASMGVPMYLSSLATSRKTAVITEMRTIATTVDYYFITYNRFPDSLAEVGMDHMRDPWGNPYDYLRLDTIGQNGGNVGGNGVGGNGKGNGGNGGNNAGGVGQARKDHNLVPINSDYDLYSKGPDGKSSSPLTAAISRDDIIRAQNGNFFGLASDY